MVVESQDILLGYLDSTLSPEQVQALEAPFTIEEVMRAIKHSSSSSSPGRDGLPFSFYKVFGECLAETLTELCNQVWTVGKIQASALSCVISLIFKQKGDEADLKNWRPIALLNCDLKILTKLLAYCLQASVSSLIHPSQTGFIQGQLIQDNCMTISQVLEYYRQTPAAGPGSLLFLDQEKAYDRVDWSYLKRCLQRFGFSPKWLHAISTIYSNLSGSVLVNHFLSCPFQISQGLRQGDPLSPLLYNLVLEPLLCFLQRQVSGLHLPGLHFQASAFCDDIVVAVSQVEDFRQVEQGIHLHESASNAKLNTGKCETLPLTSTSRDLLPGLGQWLPRDQVFQHLGIPFHPQCFPLPQGWFNSLLDKLRRTITSWQKCKISMAGRVLIINSQLLSKLWYLAYFVSFPPWFFKALSRIVSAFLWDSKHSQISLSSIQVPSKARGLGLIKPEY